MRKHISAERLVMIGTYTQQGGQGIYPLWLDLDTGRMTMAGQPYPLENASWLSSSSDENLIFAVSETDSFAGRPGGSLASLSWQIDAERNVIIRQIDQISSIGSGPCHLLIDTDQQKLVTANYGSGSAYICSYDRSGRFCRDHNGSVRGMLIQNSGSGKDPQRQEGPHMHYAGHSPDHAGILLVDLGLDQVSFYRWDYLADQENTVNEVRSAWSTQCPAGSGPRHLAGHPDSSVIYCVFELSSQVAVSRWHEGGATFSHFISTLPDGWHGQNTAAAIKVCHNGTWLLVSNRGHDSLMLARIRPDSGLLYDQQWVSCAGQTPRDAVIIDRDDQTSWLVTANQDSGQIVVSPFNMISGHVSAPVTRLDIPSPVRILSID